MTQSQQLANQFREVHLNGHWIAATNLKKEVEDLSWQQATTKIGNLNTIALLCFHINYYIAGLVDFFVKGELKIRDKYSFDMPPLQSEADWDKLREKMWKDAEKFANHIEHLSEEQLNAVFIDEKYGDYRRNIAGMIEHTYYHLGQIVLLKKLVLSS